MQASPAFRVEYTLTRAHIQRVIGHYGKYRALLAEAWNLHTKLDREADASVGTGIALELSATLALAGLSEEAGDWIKRARTTAIRAGTTTDVARADVGVATWQGSRGKLKECEKVSARVVAQAEELEDLMLVAEALPVWSDCLRLQGRWSEALAKLYRWTPVLRAGEAPSAYVRLLLATAWCEVDLCRLGRAQECVDELFATLRQGEHLDLRLQADLVSGRILVASGSNRDAKVVLESVIERSRTAELVVIAEHARAILGELLVTTGKLEQGEAELRAACQRLAASGDLPTLTWASIARTRALSSHRDPTALLAPIRHYVESQPVTVARLEWWLATARRARATGQDPAAAATRARDLLDRISGRLDDTDRAALRVHPWGRDLRAIGLSTTVPAAPSGEA
jgi:hypothetical protein